MKILFCDWNGTLLNDMPIWNEAMRKTFITAGKEPPTIEEFFQKSETCDYLEVYRRRGITVSREELNAIFIPTYEARLPDTKLFPEVEKTLLRLKNKNVRLALVTAQPDMLVIPLLTKFMIIDLFHHLSFHTLDKKSQILRIMRGNNADPRECYYVGDAPSDMRQAKKAGVNTIALLTCHIPEDLLKATNADHYIRNLEEVLNIL